jgi:uncharacterized protein (DUF427 family)
MVSENRITIEPHPGRVTVRFNGRVIVNSKRALRLREGRYDPVLYLPREDADMSLLSRTSRTTHCPYKGDAAYYSIEVEGQRVENAVWTYEGPKADVASIAGHLAFYPQKVEIGEEAAAG